MPHIMPIHWMMIYFFIWFLITTYISFTYFYFNKSLNKKIFLNYSFYWKF